MAFGAGAGSPLSLVSLLASAVWLTLSARMLAEPLGNAARWLFHGYDLSENARWGLGAGMVILVELVYVNRQRVTTLLVETPAGWIGDLFLLTVPGTSPSFGHAGIVFMVSLVLTVLSVLFSLRTARFVWYSDPVFNQPDEESPTDTTTAQQHSLFGGLTGVLGQDTARSLR